MGLLGCPASFQRLMEGVLRNIANVIVYIVDLLVHSQNHKDHLKVLEQVLDRIHTHNLKINLDKCFFGNKEVSYLGFMLTPEGIKPGKNKLLARFRHSIQKGGYHASRLFVKTTLHK